MKLRWDTKKEYTYDGTEKEHKASVENALPQDKEYLELIHVNQEKTQPGKYIAEVTGLEGTAASNYNFATLDPDSDPKNSDWEIITGVTWKDPDNDSWGVYNGENHVIDPDEGSFTVKYSMRQNGTYVSLAEFNAQENLVNVKLDGAGRVASYPIYYKIYTDDKPEGSETQTLEYTIKRATLDIRIYQDGITYGEEVKYEPGDKVLVRDIFFGTEDEEGNIIHDFVNDTDREQIVSIFSNATSPMYKTFVFDAEDNIVNIIPYTRQAGLHAIGIGSMTGQGGQHNLTYQQDPDDDEVWRAVFTSRTIATNYEMDFYLTGFEVYQKVIGAEWSMLDSFVYNGEAQTYHGADVTGLEEGDVVFFDYTDDSVLKATRPGEYTAEIEDIIGLYAKNYRLPWEGDEENEADPEYADLSGHTHGILPQGRRSSQR